MRVLVAEILADHGPAVVGPLVAAQGDPNESVRWAAVEALGRIGEAATAAIDPLAVALTDMSRAVRSAAATALGRIGPAPAIIDPLIAALGDQGDDLMPGCHPSVRRSRLATDDDVYEQEGEEPPDLFSGGASGGAVRQAAAMALAHLGPQAAGAVAALVVALYDPEKDVQDSAATALGQIGAASVEPMIDALHCRRVRRLAGRVLSEVGSDAVEALGAILDDPEIAVRRTAVRALGNIGVAGIGPLMTALGDRDKRVRLDAVRGLGSIGRPAAGALVSILGNRNATVRRETATVLGKMIPLLAEAVGPLVTALADKKKKVRRTAAVALGNVGPAAEPAVGPLVAALDDPDEAVICAAAKSLGKIGPAAEAAVTRLILLLPVSGETPSHEAGPTSGRPRPGNRGIQASRVAAEALGRIGASAAPAAEALRVALTASDKSLSRAAADALGKIGRPGGEQLCRILSDPAASDDAKLTAVTILGQMGAASVGTMISLLDDPGLRSAAVATLAKIGRPAIERLAVALLHPEKIVRQKAAEILGMIGPDAAAVIGPLSARLADSEADVRKVAAEALGKTGPCAARALAAAPLDHDPRVRRFQVWGFSVPHQVCR